MPCDGRLTQMIYVPGELFSVNPATARGVPGLFARNERVVCAFDTAIGPLAVIFVGALNVGSIGLVRIGEVTPQRPRRPRLIEVPSEPLVLERGAELGRFNMGSTVIVLFAEKAMRLDAAMRAGQAVKVGQRLGEWL
jgi:phosphatidylserine decarboxylase